MQLFTYTVTVAIDNTEGIEHNANELGRAIIGWGCSPECEGPYDIISAIVTIGDVRTEWRQTGGKVKG